MQLAHDHRLDGGAFSPSRAITLYRQGPRGLAFGRQPASPAMEQGSLIHAALLEPHTLDAKWVAMPEGLDRRTKEGKATYAELEATGKQVVASSVMETMRACVEGLLSHNVAAGWLTHPLCRTEVTLSGEILGNTLQARADAVVPPVASDNGIGVVVDIKTTRATNVRKAIYDWCYSDLWLQTLFYAGLTPANTSIYLIFVQTIRPFEVWVVDVTDIEQHSRSWGRARLLELCASYRHWCTEVAEGRVSRIFALPQKTSAGVLVGREIAPIPTDLLTYTADAAEDGE